MSLVDSTNAKLILLLPPLPNFNRELLLVQNASDFYKGFHSGRSASEARKSIIK